MSVDVVVILSSDSFCICLANIKTAQGQRNVVKHLQTVEAFNTKINSKNSSPEKIFVRENQGMQKKERLEAKLDVVRCMKH